MTEEQKTLLSQKNRVLDLCHGRGHLCGKILGDLGADVIQIEKPGGDPSRNIGPFHGDVIHPEKSLWWFAFNMHKRGITLDIETADGKEILETLVKTADFVIESFEPGHMDSIGLGYPVLEEINPGIVMVSLSGFGQTGPYAYYKAPDIVLMSMGGQAFMAGDDDRPPVQISYPHAWSLAGLHGCVGAIYAYYWREMTGEGQHVDAAAQLGVLWTHMNAMMTWDLNRINITRGGAIRRQQRILPDGSKPVITFRSTFPCRDGYVYSLLSGGVVGAPRMRILIDWMDSEGMAPDWMKDYDWVNDYDYSVITQEKIDMVQDPISEFFMSHTMTELYEEALRRGYWLVPIGTPKSIVEDRQLAFREFWAEIEHPELGDILTYPGWPIKQSETPWRVQRRAPLIGEHNEDIYENELGFSKETLSALKARGVI